MDIKSWLHDELENARNKHMTLPELNAALAQRFGRRLNMNNINLLLQELPLPQLAYVVILPGGPPWCVQIHEEDLVNGNRVERMIGHAHNSTVGRAIVQAWLDYMSRQER